MPPYVVRTFLQQAKKAHQRSSAIRKEFNTASQEEKRTSDYTDYSGYRRSKRCLDPLDMTRSKWGRHRHEENRDHHERDKKFANHRTEISQQTPPAGPADIYHSFACDEFTGDRANHRSNK